MPTNIFLEEGASPVPKKITLKPEKVLSWKKYITSILVFRKNIPIAKFLDRLKNDKK